MESGQRLSTYEMRRRAPLHFWSRAENARLAAHLLAQAATGTASLDLSEIGYGGRPAIAFSEAFLREAAIAIELIVKALIAQQIELSVALPQVTDVRPTHDVPRLWQDAQLPQLPRSDKGRLIFMKQILIWKGRYPAPNKDEDVHRDWEQLLPYHDTVVNFSNGLKTHRSLSLNWTDFDRIYQTVNIEFLTLRQRFSL